MVSPTNMAAVRAAYDAFASNDLDRFLSLLNPDFVSRQSDAVPWRGTHHGRDGVRNMFRQVGEHATATYEPREFIDGQDRIVVIGEARITPKTSGRPFDVRELHVWQIHDGKLTGLDVFLNAPTTLLTELEQ